MENSTDDGRGERIAYTALESGTPVFDSEGGQVGTLTKVLALVDEDIFDGVLIDAGLKTHFIDADEVGLIWERRLELKLTKEQVEQKPAHEGPSPS